ncbi:MAG: ribonuclease III [Acholeplasmataceae bacterium]|nr:ribonuclease III [Acholeplasmataceae bacterium]MCK9233580.1 ribonuclease III [Acholeplasmataceae bacterium]MCK9288776.1 ribonuclease III [Acholeplasmataceae bacterium]MCK9427318.1 ribonuclease III [Acholeplasmataceae bacterium]MDD4090213.1 ribonuclease III [Acholeplasmataceae bacterium]
MNSKLEEKLQVKFKNQELLQQALTHSSYANENLVLDNERLEFLGDAIIGLLMGEHLFFTNKMSEGEMSKKRAELVCEEALAFYGEQISLADYLLLGKGVVQLGGKSNPAIIADAFEALFGAVYLEFGFQQVKDLFLKLVVPYIEKVKIVDYKSTLQELVQIERRNITYQVEKEEGPAHDKTFTVSVKMDNLTLGIGVAKTKKEAEQEAAKEALKKVAKE